MNEGVGDFISGLFTKGAGAFSDVIKNKIASYLYQYLGIEEGTFLGTVIEKMVQQVDFAEYGDLIMGGSIPVDKIAPKLADATIETITVMGIRPIAQKLNVKDTNGLIYRTIEEMISNETKKNDFKDTLTSFYTWVLGGGSPNKPNQNALFKPAVKDKTGNPKSMFDFTPDEKKKIESDPAVKSASQSSGINVANILSSLTGGDPTSQGKSLVGGA